MKKSRNNFTADLKLAHFPIRSPLAIAVLPSMSLIPPAPFTDNTDSALLYPRMTRTHADQPLQQIDNEDPQELELGTTKSFLPSLSSV
jgi:hypothetical protein